VIESLVLQALVCQGQADRASALIELERALLLAEAEGYVPVFVDAGAPMAELVMQVAQGTSAVAAYSAKLLAAFPRGLRGEI
jgi:hypothetical protein